MTHKFHPHITETAPFSWHISSYSTGRGRDCVEVAVSTTVAVRDSRHREAGHLTFPHHSWAVFLSTVTTDGFPLI